GHASDAARGSDDRESADRKSAVVDSESDAAVSTSDRRASEPTMSTRDNTLRQRYRTRTSR
ncbi:MAG: hypothetical protein ACOCPY_03535, partial [Halorubrum sp.]